MMSRPRGWIRKSNPAFENTGNCALTAMAANREAHNLPSLSAAAAIADQLVWTGAVGFSDIAANVPVTPDTYYRIGRITEKTKTPLECRLRASVCKLKSK